MQTVFFKPPSTPLAAWISKLEAWLDAAMMDVAAGKTTVSAGAGDVSFSKSVSINPERRVEQLIEALALYDPDNYAEAKPIRRTRAQFL